jgi:hypothetical protein
MTIKTPDKKQARALQKRTGWAYQECLLRVKTMSVEAIEALVKLRGDERQV